MAKKSTKRATRSAESETPEAENPATEKARSLELLWDTAIPTVSDALYALPVDFPGDKLEELKRMSIQAQDVRASLFEEMRASANMLSGASESKPSERKFAASARLFQQACYEFQQAITVRDQRIMAQIERDMSQAE